MLHLFSRHLLKGKSLTNNENIFSSIYASSAKFEKEPISDQLYNFTTSTLGQGDASNFKDTPNHWTLFVTGIKYVFY